MITHDITDRFRGAANLVVPGTLIKDAHFSLFEAVGALEVGDPKMDSGCLEPGDSLEEQFDLRRPLLSEELLWLMDQLLNREVAWLTGYPLSQTLFTSVHIDRLLWPDPKTLDDSTFIRNESGPAADLSHAILRTFCLLLIKSCDLVLRMVTQQHYYEEEDFTTQLFNRELLHRFSSESILENAERAMQELQSANFAPDKGTALARRVRLRCEILQMLVHHAAGRSTDDSNFQAMHEIFDQMQSTCHLDIEVKDAFSTKLQRRLASTVPPRPMVTVSMDQVWTFWHQMLHDCQNVFSVHATGHSQDLLTAYQLFAYSSPQPSSYPRALLQSFLTLDGMVTSRLEPLHFLEEDLRSLTLPASPLLSTSKNDYGILYFSKRDIASNMKGFVEKVEYYFLTVYRACCLNACRIRRTFCHALVEWDAIQGEMEEADNVIQSLSLEKAVVPPGSSQPTYSFSLSSWIYHHKLTIHRLTVQMGFQQMIYAPHELAGMHYYLSSVCGIHLSHLERMCHFVVNRDTIIKQSKFSADIRAKGAAECQAALDRLFRQYAWVKATNLLASTLHVIFVVLNRWQVFTASKPFYSNDDLRYEIRMKPFLSLAIPEPMSSEEFARETSLQQSSIEALLDDATGLSTSAKKAWEEVSKTSWNVFPLNEAASEGNGKGVEASVLDAKWNDDVKSCVRASIAAGICVVKLKKAVHDKPWKERARKESRLPGFGDKGRWHQWWVVPSLP